MKGNTMRVITDKNKCTGCMACVNICPKHCIHAKSDDEGFIYPDIDKSECIECGLCKNLCQGSHTPYQKGTAYACINNDEKARNESSSGGIFTLIAEYTLNQNGIVFGAAFDENLNVHHIKAENKEQLKKLRGSKYVQSNTGSILRQAKEALTNGKLVLFSGTPCQISGLKAFLGKEYDNLITQDIVCHGVPSPMVWQEYLKHQSFVNNKDINKNTPPSFRKKDSGWKHYSVSLSFSDNSDCVILHHDDLFMKSFLKDLSLRPSCYQCPVKSKKCESDITLADFWGIENILPEMYDDKGTSLVLVNSEKGNFLFNAISDKMRYKQVDFDTAVKFNSSISQSASIPKKRDKFMKMAKNGSFCKAVQICTKESLYRRLVWKAKSIISKIKN